MKEPFLMPAILWLAMLPENEYKAALSNIDKAGYYDITNERDSLELVLAGAFDWYETIEGHKYWQAIANDIKYK